MSDPVLDPSILALYRDRYDEDVRLTRSRHGQLMAASPHLLGVARVPLVASGG